MTSLTPPLWAPLQRSQRRPNKRSIMGSSIILLMLTAMPAFGQATSTGNAKTGGPCSPAVSGNNNRIIMDCRGFGGEKVEAPAFHEKIGTVYFSLGEHGLIMGQGVEQLPKG